MREIKFRAWDDGVSRMFDWKSVSWHFPQLMANDNIHVMQFTGLKDKNGKEIYEGDIVKAYDGEIEEVKYLTGSEYDFQGFPLCQVFGNYEVIGNIYENPELLK